ncbi:MAG: LVIVD repeat-containing protein, partial [Nocardioidaceae bacterium]
RMTHRTFPRRRAVLAAGAAAVLAVTLAPSATSADPPDPDDPRVGIAPGYFPWHEVASNIDHIDNDPRVAPFDAPPGNFGFVNSDLALQGDFAFVGSFNGFQVYDISDPTDPVLHTSYVCPGGQGDLSVYGDLLFMSVEETRGRIDCGTQGAPGAVNLERFRGVRIFDISDMDEIVQLPGVQTCRGSHTHSIVTDPDDPNNLYIYNSGTSGVRPAAELAGCENAALTQAPVTTGNPTQWRIDVIRVPLAAPGTASIVSQPRIFTDADTGAFNGLQNTLPCAQQPAGCMHPSGTPYSPLPNTNTCHDITSYEARELVAGACQGNGILLDVSDPVNPVRLDAVSDPNFSYWHSASFNNDGTKVMFTDEWGGGTSPRCRSTDQLEWGADAFFDIGDNNQMEFANYFKMPAVQTNQENCVAHNSSVVPVPGRDILVQAWYQGGVSVIDFTDTANPVEIAYFDRGPIDVPTPGALNLGGLWSTYWYNGQVYGTEIARGFDTFSLLESDMLSENELDAAREVVQDEFNSQNQHKIVWTPSFNVAGSYFDQAVRSGELAGATLDKVSKSLAKAERLADKGETASAVDLLNTAIRQLDDEGDQGELRTALEELRDSLLD